jgi:hypothetical protein
MGNFFSIRMRSSLIFKFENTAWFPLTLYKWTFLDIVIAKLGFATICIESIGIIVSLWCLIGRKAYILFFISGHNFFVNFLHLFLFLPMTQLWDISHNIVLLFKIILAFSDLKIEGNLIHVPLIIYIFQYVPHMTIVLGAERSSYRLWVPISH